MAVVRIDEGELRRRITQIQLDQSLTDAEKAKKRQELLSGRWSQPASKDPEEGATGKLDLTSCFLECVIVRVGQLNSRALYLHQM